jgi:hypothetical protein
MLWGSSSHKPLPEDRFPRRHDHEHVLYLALDRLAGRAAKVATWPARLIGAAVSRWAFLFSRTPAPAPLRGQVGNGLATGGGKPIPV